MVNDFEIWLSIDGYPNYEVSNLGGIRNVKTGKILKTNPGSNGYPKVELYSSPTSSKTHSVHRIVALTFFDVDDFSLEVNHDDGNKTNLFVGNLDFVTESQNKQHAYDSGLRVPPNQKRIRILETGKEFESISECARYIGGQQSHISDCLHGKLRKHKGYTFAFVDY